MSENQIIPVPDKSGGDGKQVARESTADFQEANPLEGLPMAKAIDGLASSHSRSLGGEVTSALIAGATTQLALDYRELKESKRSKKYYLAAVATVAGSKFQGSSAL